jgi:hypothetical protein
VIWLHGAGVRDEIVTLSSSSDGSLDVSNVFDKRTVDGLVKVSDRVFLFLTQTKSEHLAQDIREELDNKQPWPPSPENGSCV